MLSKTKPNKKRRSRKQSKPEENLKNIKKFIDRFCNPYLEMKNHATFC